MSHKKLTIGCTHVFISVYVRLCECNRHIIVHVAQWPACSHIYIATQNFDVLQHVVNMLATLSADGSMVVPVESGSV